jgi:WD40 repeat protein/DNA-binding SARP family transcriptional activator
VRIAVLGPLELDEGDARLGSRDRIVLTALAIHPGEVLSPEQLAEAVWGETLPASWAKNVQGCISRLRQRLGPDSIETSAHGYRLGASAGVVDATEFTAAAARARELLGLKEYERARYVAGQALQLWRGNPLTELAQWELARSEVRRLCEVHAELEDLVVEASLAAGHHREVLARAATMVEAAPLEEHRWALLARAQYQSGRQFEALRTLRRVRVILQRELGLDPGPDLVALEQAILRQDPDLLVRETPEGGAAVSPYPGLTPYGEADAESFFGREDEITSCLDRLSRTPFVAVIGPSGSGKSSLLRAGLAPALRREGSEVITMTPGRHPLAALTALEVPTTSTVLVDQVEEAFTLGADEAELDDFLSALVTHTEHGRVVLALRADHTGNLTAHPGLARLVEHGLFLLPVMSADSLRSAIEGPARLNGLVLEPGLTDLLVREVEGEPGALPLLSHALRETWLRHEGRTLTVAGYQASGGIRGAVAQSAEQLYGRLDEHDRTQVRELVLRLVVPGPEGEPVRGRIPRHQVVVSEAQDHLVDQMVAARLVTSDQGAIELAHEAVVRAWPRLRGWLEDDLEGQRKRHRLTQASEDWSALGFQESELYRGARLADVLEWVSATDPQLTEVEERFLRASTTLAEAEERSVVELARTRGRMVRRLRVALLGATVLLVVALVAGFLAMGQSRKADHASLSADAARVGAQAMVSPDITTSLLMAVAGARLDPSQVTQRNLEAVLAQHPLLIGSVTTPTSGALSGVAISPDGRTLAVSDKTHHVWTYDARTLAPLEDAQIGDPFPTNFDTPIAFSPIGVSLAVGAPPSREDPLVRLLDPTTLQPLPDQLSGWPDRWGQLVGLAYSGDGRFLAASVDVGRQPNDRSPTTGRGVALVWNVAAPGTPLVRRVPLFWASDDPVALSPDGATLYGGMPLAAYDVRTGGRLFGNPSEGSGLLAIDPTGRLLALSFDTGKVSLVDARTGRVIARLQGPDGELDKLEFSHDGTRLAATSRDSSAFVWRVHRAGPDITWWLLQRLADGAQSASGISFSLDDGTLFVTGGDTHELHAWDLTDTRTLLASLPIKRPESLSGAFIRNSPDGDTVAAIQGQGDFTDRTGREELRLIDVTSGATTRPLETHGLGVAGSWSPDGRRYAFGSSDGWVQVFSNATHRVVVQRHVINGFIPEVSYTPDGARIAVDNTLGDVTLLDAATLRPIGPVVQLPRADTGEMSAGPDNRTAFVTSADRKPGPGWSDGVTHWWLVDLVSGRILQQGDLDVDAMYTAFSPTGDRVAIAGWGGRLELLDPQTGRQVRPTMIGPSEVVMSVTFNADGSRMASGATGGDVELWDGRTGELVSTAQVPGKERTAIPGFRPDGTLTVASFTGRVYRWDPSLEDAIDAACRAAGRDITQSEWARILPGQTYRSLCPDSG